MATMEGERYVGIKGTYAVSYFMVLCSVLVIVNFEAGTRV
jgi:hypothetical protein